MKIQNNGSAWLGSFAMAVQQIATEVLHDGPVPASIVYEADSGNLNTFTGKLESVSPGSGTLTMQDGPEVDVYSLRSLDLLD